MRIGIVGWGLHGRGAYEYFGPQHEYLIVNEHPRDDFPTESDKVKVQFLQTDKPLGVTGNVEDLSYLKGLDSCDKVVYSPTAYKNLQKYFGDNKGFWAKTTNEERIFFETVKTKNIIGITGTKGKGTTSTLIYKILEAAGKKVFLGGNIGRSLFEFVREVEPDDWVVLELSSFQLQGFPYSPHIGVCLMILPEHLDYHSDMEEYLAAKANLFRHQKPDDVAIYFADNEYSKQLADYSPGTKLPYYQKPGAYVRANGMIVAGDGAEIIDKKDVKLLGEHNLQNICAALTATWFTLSGVEGHTKIEAVRSVLTSFSGLEHRLEFVRELNGVKYYDDSFGTTPETAIVALKAFSEPKTVILGGSDKSIPFDGLAEEVVKSNVKHVIAIGETGHKIAQLLRQKGFNAVTEGLTTMPQMVAAAQKTAQPGDIVLLSTGCASFGLFKDYKDRGNQFKSAVLALS